ncbi:hypothetical protein IFM89_017160 [Coptis chinensis]|uniref:Uncharacterized protein n=1 Tax=Coptis chinensis TaxID=261450 RepID=A0A835HVB3_9MAGN|nr:hypothetical protein IFM89_017160 [Coptis chinensis]
MHGVQRRCLEEEEIENCCFRRKTRRHMWPVPSVVLAAAADSSSSVITFDSFCKDGRKITVGDCALFKPLQDTSPPFIGIIRGLTRDKDNYLKLGVNWLYRPADVKLAKGILLEAAPNEIFYSFHKDEIPAASLLHPCKVAFLRKGVDLPSGISSFICRRVYDTSNKRLWWLTDQNYINERQEEVDQLLDKTRQEMHAAVQSGGRSPKTLNGPTPTPQLKPGSDGTQNSANSFSSQVKGRKRERIDQGSEPIKKERSMRTDDANSGQHKSEGTLKSEIAKITEKGGLVDFEGVEKLVQLMQPDRVEKKIDLAGRMMLADVITVTDNYDCLGKFVQLRGLSVLDEWLQEVHKGKTGDGTITKEGDRSVEDFLLALLRALDKLPVDLHALQTCNVGKSVNHLRSHKNLEIQKKARGLVDTWKKRVEAEMNMNDAKSGPNQAVSWPNKPGFPEVPHGGTRRAGGSSEVPVKSSVTQPTASKAAPVKLSHGDSSSKLSPGSVKSSPSLSSPVAITRDSPCRMPIGCSASDILSTIREEKSSSSSQSQNNSQSCSSDHAKPVGSLWKEDARSSTAGSLNAIKTSSGATRHRKSSNGTAGPAVSGVQKETTLVKCGSMERKATSEKVSQAGLTGERTVDIPLVDNGNNHRLIVRLPNLGRSPARNANGGSLDDPSSMVSRASSPRFPEKHDHFDRKVKVKGDSCRTNVAGVVNKELRHRNDLKDGLAGSDEGAESPASFHDEEHERTGDNAGKALETSKGNCSSTGIYKGDYLNESKPGKMHEASFRSINVLIDSCVKYSEAIPSMPVGDDRGMNLLASVAAGEMSKSEQVSPIGSPGRSSSVNEDSYAVNDAKRLCSVDAAIRCQRRPDDSADGDTGKQVSVASPFQVKGDEQHLNRDASSSKILEESRTATSVPEEKSTGEHREQLRLSTPNLQQGADACLKSDGKPEAASASVALLSTEKREEFADCERTDGGKTNVPSRDPDSVQDLKSVTESSLNKKDDKADEKLAEASLITNASVMVRGSVGGACDIENGATIVKVERKGGESSSCLPSGTTVENKNFVHEGSGDGISTENKLSSTLNCVVGGSAEVAELSSKSSVVVDPSTVNEKVCSVEERTHVKQNESQRIDTASTVPANADNNTSAAVGSEVSDHEKSVQISSEQKEVVGGSFLNEDSSKIPCLEATKNVKPCGNDADQSEECLSTAEASSMSVPAGSELGAKLDFDLNEGFPVDEENQGDLVVSAGPGCSSVGNLHGSLSFLPPLSNGLPLVPVAAAAKGPFVPPENFLRSSGEIGWRGSAATSAFRPAEPRRVLEMQLTTDIPPDTASSKQGRSPLDIDLNEPDDKFQEDMSLHCSVQVSGSVPGVLNIRDFRRNEGFGFSSAPIRNVGGLDLDLNRVDEDTDTGQLSTNTGRRFEVMSARQSSSSGFSVGEVNVLRNFDLNNGPGLDEVGLEQPQTRQHSKSSMPFLPPGSSIRMNNAEFGTLSSWFPPGNSYPAVAIPSILPDRVEQVYPVVSSAGSQRILGPPTGGIAFSPDGYRGPVLSSSPAVAFSPASPFPYPGFPFGTNFPLPATSFSSGSTMFLDSPSTGGLCFPTVPSQLLGAAGAVSSHYTRPYVINLPDGSSNSGAESSRRWMRQGLDLNAGPGVIDTEGRDERLASASRQLSGASSQTLAEEQMRMYQAAGAAMKRKEPEGGWDAERFGYRQHSWQ